MKNLKLLNLSTLATALCLSTLSLCAMDKDGDDPTKKSGQPSPQRTLDPRDSSSSLGNEDISATLFDIRANSIERLLEQAELVIRVPDEFAGLFESGEPPYVLLAMITRGRATMNDSGIVTFQPASSCPLGAFPEQRRSTNVISTEAASVIQEFVPGSVRLTKKSDEAASAS